MPRQRLKFVKKIDHRRRGWVDDKGNITPAGEREAERRHFGDDEPPEDDSNAPHGWAPDPYEGGELR